MKSLKIPSFLVISVLFILISCRSNSDSNKNRQALDPGIPDDYSEVADPAKYKQWGPYNVHDPSIIRSGNYYYVYSTDAVYLKRSMRHKLDSIKTGNIQVRRSKDLVHWEFLGWALDTIPPEAIEHIQQASGGKMPGNIWAPYIMKFRDTFRLYYSVSVFGANTSYIGLAVSKSPEGPWKLSGCVVKTDTSSAMNSIDPTVVVDRNNDKHWMIYGSYFGGIYCVELDPQTGLTLHKGDQGVPVARRADGKNKIIEAPEVIYNPELNKYFLFVSYEPLFTHYNVRVGRADKPEGPYLDYFGRDMADPENNYPVITYAYRFQNHPGWAGTGHCGVIDDDGRYFMVHQGRLAPDNQMMVLHVRQIFWTADGWPVVSPERYSGLPEKKILPGDIPGTWEVMELNEIYDSVNLWQGQIPHGGWKYDTLMFNNSLQTVLIKDGSVKDKPGIGWELSGDLLVIKGPSPGESVSVKVFSAWDWENKRPTIAFTGLKADGRTYWGKKAP